MTMFSNMKKNRKARTSKLRDTVEKSQKKSSYDDPRMWQCAMDKAGNGMAIIRFLPASPADMANHIEVNNGSPDDLIPFWTSQFTHRFKGANGKWYINNCPTSIEEDCPICSANGVLVDKNGGWGSMSDENPDKKLVRDRKRKEVFYTNVLIIKDTANPENEGQVKIFRFGPSINEKIQSVIFPEFDDEESIDPSDVWAGCNFRLKIRRYKGHANYDKCSFDDPSPISDDDAEAEAIWNKTFPLFEFVGKDKYKPLEKLNKEFARTANTLQAATKAASNSAGDDTPVNAGKTVDDAPATTPPNAENQTMMQSLLDGVSEDDIPY